MNDIEKNGGIRFSLKILWRLRIKALKSSLDTKKKSIAAQNVAA